MERAFNGAYFDQSIIVYFILTLITSKYNAVTSMFSAQIHLILDVCLLFPVIFLYFDYMFFLILFSQNLANSFEISELCFEGLGR